MAWVSSMAMVRIADEINARRNPDIAENMVRMFPRHPAERPDLASRQAAVDESARVIIERLNISEDRP